MHLISSHYHHRWVCLDCNETAIVPWWASTPNSRGSQLEWNLVIIHLTGRSCKRHFPLNNFFVQGLEGLSTVIRQLKKRWNSLWGPKPDYLVGAAFITMIGHSQKAQIDDWEALNLSVLYSLWSWQRSYQRKEEMKKEETSSTTEGVLFPERTCEEHPRTGDWLTKREEESSAVLSLRERI